MRHPDGDYTHTGTLKHAKITEVNKTFGDDGLSILYEDVYAMASVLGGIVICVLYPHTGIVYASWSGFGAVLLLRICAIIFG